MEAVDELLVRPVGRVGRVLLGDDQARPRPPPVPRSRRRAARVGQAVRRRSWSGARRRRSGCARVTGPIRSGENRYRYRLAALIGGPPQLAGRARPAPASSRHASGASSTASSTVRGATQSPAREGCRRRRYRALLRQRGAPQSTSDRAVDGALLAGPDVLEQRLVRSPASRSQGAQLPGDARPLQPRRWPRRGRRCRQLRADHLVRGDDRDRPALRGQRLGDGHADRPADRVVHHGPAGRERRTGQGRQGVQSAASAASPGMRPRAGEPVASITAVPAGPGGVQVRRGDLGPGVQPDAQPPALGFEPAGQQRQAFPAGPGGGRAQASRRGARARSASRTGVPAQRGHPGGLQAGRAAADDEHVPPGLAGGPPAARWPPPARWPWVRWPRWARPSRGRCAGRRRR